ncbi:unnamed protein product, partial [Protopolystoma xenopodis]
LLLRQRGVEHLLNILTNQQAFVFGHVDSLASDALKTDLNEASSETQQCRRRRRYHKFSNDSETEPSESGPSSQLSLTGGIRKMTSSETKDYANSRILTLSVCVASSTTGIPKTA